jgi:hypothetical protein
MTDTITTDAGDTADSAHPATGSLEHIDPHTLILETNVRDEADVDADFLASIKEHGVLTPIAAVRDADGQLRVRAGQRRALAARAAGLPTVPVYVRPATASDEKTQTVERVSEQIVENDQRRQLTDAQRARGIQQMLDAGLSVPKVAKIDRTDSPMPATKRAISPRWDLPVSGRGCLRTGWRDQRRRINRTTAAAQLFDHPPVAFARLPLRCVPHTGGVVLSADDYGLVDQRLIAAPIMI